MRPRSWEVPLADPTATPLADPATLPQTSDPIAGLIDIPLPEPVSLWPQTWPSRILLVLVVVGLVYGTVRAIHHWRVNRYRRQALSELKGIEARATTLTPADLASALASLLRRTALAAFPRDEVAVLTGAAWLSFLDRTGGGQAFSQGPGRVLEITVYGPAAGGDPAGQIGAVRGWIRGHRREPRP